MNTIFFVAGGTGGHVIPAITLAHECLRQKSDLNIVFVGTRNGMEKTLVPNAGFKLEFLKVRGLKGKGLLSKIKNILFVPMSMVDSFVLLKKYKPSVVFGIGGYASGPMLLIASLLGTYTAILEPNAVAGLTNRILGKFVSNVFLAFEKAEHYFNLKKTHVLGNPIRKEILAVGPPNFDAIPLTLLVFGGSQGAHQINVSVVEAIKIMRDQKKEFRIEHQTGEKDFEWVSEAYAEMGVDAQVSKFIEDMAGAYARSHLVVARSGSSVLEMAAVGRPSILIPYPFAADDHQKENAKSFGSAVDVLSDELCTGQNLATLISSYLQDRKKLKEKSLKIMSYKKENASEEIIKFVLEQSRVQKTEPDRDQKRKM